MDKDEPEISGYVHNVSPIKKSSKATYFDMQVQTKSELLRAVCFSPKKHTEFESKCKSVSPVKLKKFKLDDKNNNKTILLNYGAEIIDTTVDFEPQPIPPTNNIASLTGAHLHQLVTITGKVTQLTGIKKVNTQSGVKRKVDCYLIDPSGSIKLTAWEHHTQELAEGKTYRFENLRVTKEFNSDNLALSTAKQECTITECQGFQAPLVNPTELPDSFTDKQITSEIIGISSFETYSSCRACYKKITSPDPAALIVKCSNCKLLQKKSKCPTKCVVQALVDVHEHSKITLTLFTETIQQIFCLLSLPTSQNEGEVTSALLDCPLLNITYDQKTKIVSNVSLHGSLKEGSNNS